MATSHRLHTQIYCMLKYSEIHRPISPSKRVWIFIKFSQWLYETLPNTLPISNLENNYNKRKLMPLKLVHAYLYRNWDVLVKLVVFESHFDPPEDNPAPSQWEYRFSIDVMRAQTIRYGNIRRYRTGNKHIPFCYNAAWFYVLFLVWYKYLLTLRCC